MVNQKNGILSKLTGLTSTLFKLNIEDINEEVDENTNPLEKAILYGNSNVKCRKILFLKDIMKLLNHINYENFLKYIYPLIVKLSNDDIEIQNEVCNRVGDLCAYLIQNNNHNDGYINLIHPYYIHKMIFFFNNMFSSHTFTLNYLNETAKKKSNYFFLNNNNNNNNNNNINEQNRSKHITLKYQASGIQMNNNINNNPNTKLKDMKKKNDILYHSTYEQHKQNEEPCLIIDEIEDIDNAFKIKAFSDNVCDIDVSFNVPEAIKQDHSDGCDKLIKTGKEVAECLYVKRDMEQENLNFCMMQESYKSEHMYDQRGDMYEHHEMLHGNYEMYEMNQTKDDYSDQKVGDLNTKLCNQLYIENHKKGSYNIKNNVDIYTHLSKINKETEINAQRCDNEFNDIFIKGQNKEDKLESNDKYSKVSSKENEENEKINQTLITNGLKNDKTNGLSYIEDKINFICMNKLTNTKRGHNINKDENLHMDNKKNNNLLDQNISNDVVLKNDCHFLNDNFTTVPSIFYNNNLFNDLIINNNHFSISIKQFFEMYSNNFKYKHFVVMEKNENDGSTDSNDLFDDNNTIINIEKRNSMQARNNPDYDYNTFCIPMNDEVLQDIDNTFIHDTNIDIDIIKSCYYNESELT
ncbi:hypothetical protein PFLG_00984 [Plasmodium falciparum RAJ116]|uniref:Uncharacterized protein n=1 Tax=Plasmodium falciparum RAJ116 TaxID=580058 RepID=A0A0L0CUK8_PLAFA|nr:hypothetical protein PFLG_00984 [Plasmodium falciparum RAJ116]